MDQWPLVGRARELSLVTKAITARNPGAGIVIGGEAGVGKSRLHNEAAAAAKALGHRCHRFAGSSSLRTIPYGAFGDVASFRSTDPLRQIRELITTFTSTPDQPVVLAIDDAHLLDDRSAFIVHELVVRELASVVVTVRCGEFVPDAITALWKDHHVPRLDLQPLSQDTTEQLLEHALGGRIESASSRRMRNLADGNALFLRRLVEDEVASGRLRLVAGIWMWSGEFTVTPSLADIVRRSMKDLPEGVVRVVDLLAISEPLSSDVLGALVGDDMVERAETIGAITTDHAEAGAVNVRLAHPLHGEVRRADLDRVTRRHLSGIVANELTRQEDARPSMMLRRAILTLESDHPADPDMLGEAMRAAMVGFDVPLATRLASAALTIEQSLESAYSHVMALVIGGEGMAAESVFSSYPTESVAPDVFARWVILRAANLVWMLARPIDAAELLKAVRDTATSPTAHAEAAVVKACILAVQARPADAVHEAEKAMAPGTLSDFYALMATAAIVMSSGSMGDIDQADQYARRGYERATSSWQTAHLQFWLAAIHGRACRVAGRIEHCREEAARLSELACDVPTLTHVQAVFLRGHSELAAGHLQSAITLLLDALVGNSSHPSVSTGLNPACLIWLGEARAVAGETAAARKTIELFDSVRPTEFAFMESGASLAVAWCAAAEGNVDEAVRISMRTAEVACTRGQFAYEVMALQTATQLGYTGAADRLSALTAMVHGPRVAVAARHASALRDANGAELLLASELFESFGDLVAAAHTAAQAGAAFAADEQRSSSLLAFETARRIAGECGCVPVVSVQDAEPVQFTNRQREIVGLVAEGLSNKDIADRLTMSVRSVEGHLYRAAQRAGVSSRGELASIQLGSHGPSVDLGQRPAMG